MIELPDPKRAYDYENAFYLTCQPGRIGKFIAHYELYKSTLGIPGAIVECGIFKGPSFARFASFRHLFEAADCREMVGFDIFGTFPDTSFGPDKEQLKKFVAAAGDQSISRDQLIEVLQTKQCERKVTLVEGDILKTVPDYVQNHPELKISLLHLDVDIYEPSQCILEHLYPRLSPGGILVLDDYAIFPGATKAVDDYFADRSEKVRKLSYCFAPHFIVKEA
ncbi:MAG TPA: TylF/MycF/NovP-related O-methyltransferase [Kiritimatiellia bacterium]|nr:TylF/MycF/NovP-related O-methyltransferase [Kiritimatiellia bacterium]